MKNVLIVLGVVVAAVATIVVCDKVARTRDEEKLKGY